ncbi:hypothetical protein ACWENQ_08465 [Nonomuraea sp. NPDC004354]
MGGQAMAADLPELEVRERAAMVTVTMHDGDKVTVTTWTTCVGVAGFVRSFLGEPSSTYVVNLREGS